MSRQDLYIMAALSLIIISVVSILYKELLLITFDEEFGNVQGAPTDALYILLLCLVALSVVVMIKVVGVILVIALLTIPASTSRLFSHNLRMMISLSIAIGVFYTSSGLVISYYANLASGATIVIFSSAMFLLATLYKEMKARKERRDILGS